MSCGGKSSKSFNTTNLRKHLELHPKEFKEFSSMEVEKVKEKGKGKRQATVDGLFERQRPYSLDHYKSKELSYCIIRIAEMMAVDLQPFSLVEDPGFCRLMREADPRYIIPSRRYFSDVLIPQIHTKITSLVLSLLSILVSLLIYGLVAIAIIHL